MRKAFRAAWLAGGLLLAGSSGAETFLVLESRGLVQRQLPGGSNDSLGGRWREVFSGEDALSGSAFRTGAASELCLWLRPMAKLSVGEKSRLRLRSQFMNGRQVHLLELEEGWASLEAPRLEASVLHEIHLGDVRVQCGKGKLLFSRKMSENAALLWQVEGESVVTADTTEDDGRPARSDALSPARGVSVSRGERLSIKDLRFAKRPFDRIPEEFEFAFPAARAKPRGRDGYLDLRERWE